MIGTYEITQGEKTVGRALVKKQGLYYHLSCRCAPTGSGMHRLMVTSAAGREDLGICVPMDGTFGVEKKIPCKRLCGGEPEFRILPREQSPVGRFVPVDPEAPFPELANLEGAVLASEDGKPGIVLRE